MESYTQFSSKKFFQVGLLTIAIATALLLLATIAYAQEESSDTEVETSAVTTTSDNSDVKIDTRMRAAAKTRADEDGSDTAIKIDAAAKARIEISQRKEEQAKVRAEKLRVEQSRLEQKSIEMAEKETNLRDRIQRHVSRILAQNNEAIRRLFNISTRLETRILRLEASGRDLSIARSMLLGANVKIEKASSNISEVQIKIEGILSDPEFNTDDAKNLTTSLREVQTSIKTAHTALVEVLREVKAGISTRTETSN